MKKRKFFVSDELVAIREFEEAVYDDDGNELAPNIIFIKEKMDVATRHKVAGSMFKVSGNKDIEVEIDIAANRMALLVNNIVRWSGPDFDEVPCRAETIGKLDPDEPFVKRVIEEIAERNKPQESPDPKSRPDAATLSKVGVTNGTANVSHLLATTTRK